MASKHQPLWLSHLRQFKIVHLYLYMVRNVNWCALFGDFVGPTHPGNQECSVEDGPCLFTPLASVTVSVSCTYPPGFTYAARGPSTDMLNM